MQFIKFYYGKYSLEELTFMIFTTFPDLLPGRQEQKSLIALYPEQESCAFPDFGLNIDFNCMKISY